MTIHGHCYFVISCHIVQVLPNVPSDAPCETVLQLAGGFEAKARFWLVAGLQQGSAVLTGDFDLNRLFSSVDGIPSSSTESSCNEFWASRAQTAMGNEVSGPVSAAQTAAENPASTPAAILSAGPAPGTTPAQAKPVAVQEGNGAAEPQRRSSASAAGDAATAPRPSALVIVGPSGVGKNTLIKQLMEGNNQFGFSISHTTRQPRQGEKVGRGDARSRHACSAGVHARPSR